MTLFNRENAERRAELAAKGVTSRQLADGSIVYTSAVKADAAPKFKPGQKVTTSGYPGVIVRQYSEGMYEVRLARGLVTVPAEDIKADDDAKADADIGAMDLKEFAALCHKHAQEVRRGSGRPPRTAS